MFLEIKFIAMHKEFLVWDLVDLIKIHQLLLNKKLLIELHKEEIKELLSHVKILLKDF